MQIILHTVDPSRVNISDNCSRLLDPFALQQLYMAWKSFPIGTVCEIKDTWQGPDRVVFHNLTSEKPLIWDVGYSPFNYGLSVELKVPEGFDPKNIDLALSAFGWWSHSRDVNKYVPIYHYVGPEGEELIPRLESENPETWGNVIEMKIYEKYLKDFQLGPANIQSALRTLRMYSGKIDGKMDGLFHTAVNAFMRAWNVNDTVTGMRLQRTLAFVSADVIIR